MKKSKIYIIQAYAGSASYSVEFKTEHPEYGSISGTMVTPAAETEEERSAWTNNKAQFYKRRIRKIAGKVKVVSSDAQAQENRELAWKLQTSQRLIKDKNDQILRLARQNKTMKEEIATRVRELNRKEEVIAESKKEIEDLKHQVKNRDLTIYGLKNMQQEVQVNAELKEHAESLAALNKGLEERNETQHKQIVDLKGELSDALDAAEQHRERALNEANRADKHENLLNRIKDAFKDWAKYVEEEMQK